jgi:hypothetical protein
LATQGVVIAGEITEVEALAGGEVLLSEMKIKVIDAAVAGSSSGAKALARSSKRLLDALTRGPKVRCRGQVYPLSADPLPLHTESSSVHIKCL